MLDTKITLSSDLERTQPDISQQYYAEMEEIRRKAREASVEPNDLEMACILTAVEVVNSRLEKLDKEYRVDETDILVSERNDQNLEEMDGGLHNFASYIKIFRLPESLPFNVKVFNYLVLNIHELIHLAAEPHIRLGRTSTGGIRETLARGYTFEKEEDEEYPTRGTGIDEAVVNLLTVELLKESLPLVFERFKINLSPYADNYNNYGSYAAEMNFLVSLITTVADRYANGDYSFVWDTMVRDLFSGHKMHLRNIERIFGPGSLRMLTLLGTEEVIPIHEIKTKVRVLRDPGISYHDQMNSVDDYIRYYFHAFSDEEKNEIEQLILPPKEFAKVQKRKEIYSRSPEYHSGIMIS